MKAVKDTSIYEGGAVAALQFAIELPWKMIGLTRSQGIENRRYTGPTDVSNELTNLPLDFKLSLLKKSGA